LVLDGYEKLINEQRNNNRLKNLTFFPVVEFRIEKFAGVEFDTLKRINLHVIFSNELSVETIKSQFLNTLEQSYVLKTGEPWTRAITAESVAELGASIKSSAPEEKLSDYENDLTEGFNNLNVKEDQIFTSLKKDCFKDKYLIAVGKTEWAALKWTDASIATKKSIINCAHIVFTSAESVEAITRSKEQLRCQRVNDLLLDCSDAHNFSDSKDKDRIGKCYTWLKANPTFDGLKQVVIEPDGRIFMGDTPPLLERIAKNRTKYIKELSITQIDGYDQRNGVWFKDITIPINSELVAIIGNKGSGKSAIADIIALCANYPSDTEFSFLTNEKFKKKRLAASFRATTVWESGKPSEINLNDQPGNTELLDVKYLPQGQFERLTNEIRTAEEFQKEIESVVFSHIPDSEKLGALSFHALIEKKTSTVNSEIEGLRNDIRDINKKIIDLERKSTTAYQAEVVNKITKKQEELDALVEPPPVLNPNDNPDKKQLNEAINKKLDDLKDEIQKLQTSIQTVEEGKKTTLEALQKLKTIKSEIQQKETEINRFISAKKQELSEFKIDVKKLISMETNFTELDALILDKEGSLEKAKVLLGELKAPDNSIPLPNQLTTKEEQLKIEKSKLDTEQQHYQKYLTDKTSWEKNKKDIIGSPDRYDTLEYYKHELDYLNKDLNNELEAVYDERRGIVRVIFDKKQEVISVYKGARDRLNKIIDENQDTLKDYKIKVDASLVKSADFNSRFLNYILQNKMGTFHSNDGGEAQLIRLLTDVDFDAKEDIVSLLDNLVLALRFDRRVNQDNAKRSVAEQVKDIPALYEYLFSLEFLEKNYQLKQGDKNLEQLSPGERGALLLVFYLLLDNNDIPLVIDQPEDNLDNHSVATILVPFIRVAKKKRQIIMVTHNPNLAVVSDAEQVIYVDLDKENNYKFSTISGSIEDKQVNKKIVDVLEGTMPAFNTRKRKYYE
jgi:ABC-type lipoprotein export system ATPase subunit